MRQWWNQVPAWVAVAVVLAVGALGSGTALAVVAGLAAAAVAGALLPRPPERAAEPARAALPVAAPRASAPPRSPARRTRAVGGTSEQAVREVAELSAASDDVAARFASVSGALDVLRRASADVHTGTTTARTGASDALTRARAAGAQVESLLEASTRIGEVTGVITSITDQTRTLALNATIEAARAGSAGKGFAVVAGEVKELASATARAAQTIAAQVQAVQEVTRSAAEAIEGVGAVLGDLDRAQTEVAEAVARQAAASEAIGDDVGRAASGSSRMAELVSARVEAEQRAFVGAALELARTLLDEAGGLAPADGEVEWEVADGAGRTTRVRLPELLLGGAPVQRNEDPSRPTPVVDEVKRLAGGTATLFQRLDQAGSMLRVATNVVGPDGRRAVGTVLPVTAPDGTPNPVLRAVLAGTTYVGEATVLGRPFFAGYAPLADEAGRVIGMLYVGLPKAVRAPAALPA